MFNTNILLFEVSRLMQF